LVEVSPDVVTVELANGPARFHALWLRDNASGHESRHTGSGQRLFDVTELPDRVEVASAEVVDGRLYVTFEPDRFSSIYESDWLETHRYDRPVTSGFVGAVPWLAHDLSIHRLMWPDRAKTSSLAETSKALVRDGVAIVDGLAAGGNEGPGVVDVANLWGPARETNYGEVFLVRAEVAPTNLAFTPNALNVHTDNPYRRPVPGYQLLHCLVASETGGVTVLLDGFQAAEVFRSEDPTAFALLTSRSVPFRWRGGGFELWNRVPVIEVEDGGPADGSIRAIRYNNRSVEPFDLPFDEMADFYQAYRAFARLLHRPELEYRFVLNPGQCMVFDNERILHGRDGEADSERLLKGCYLDRDWIHGKKYV
tara:strand:- start:2830 stop:3924 length:1095 start_codon:yes stop_codon:yes gene_type:complete